MSSVSKRKVAIIGGGLAGTACAYVLKQHGFMPVIYEAGDTLAGKASGNALGLYNPRPAADLTAQSVFFKYGFEAAYDLFSTLARDYDLDFNPCGALHLMTDEKRTLRFGKMADSWGWGADALELVNSNTASDIAGVSVSHNGMYLRKAGYISPRKLCMAYADGVDIVYNTRIENVSDIDADILILACGKGFINLNQSLDLPIKAVRGQVTTVSESARSQHLKAALCYGGYIMPSHKNKHVIGATFQRWLTHSDLVDEDDTYNLKSLYAVVPDFCDFKLYSSWAGVRVASKDHFPIVGKLDPNSAKMGQKGRALKSTIRPMYMAGALGSHGLIGSYIGALVLLDMIAGLNLSHLPKGTLNCLAPARFSYK